MTQPQRESISPESVGALLTAMMGRTVTASRAKRVPGKADLLGIYVNSEQVQKAALVVSLELAAQAAAALQIFPASRALKNIASGTLEEEFRENLREILNVCAQLVKDAVGERMTLSQVCPLQSAPAALKDALRIATNTQGFEVSVQGYGKGQMSLTAM
jgi:hypothetical protein